ncbi:hypothetical protein [Candidatus Sororendozoicomonas aggregata]|uniref:hypothetical protein n=1 Tax=Candidatus Sororendozoicomonas aggregata TaxID=3073239 RepID=UPI002ED65EAC
MIQGEGNRGRKESHGIEKRELVKCPYQDCDKGLVEAMFGSRAECHQCDGFGFVDKETGEALPEREIIRQLVIRLAHQRMEAKKKICELQRSNQYLQQRLMDWERGR